jgi:hypothetical protein
MLQIYPKLEHMKNCKVITLEVITINVVPTTSIIYKDVKLIKDPCYEYDHKIYYDYTDDADHENEYKHKCLNMYKTEFNDGRLWSCIGVVNTHDNFKSGIINISPLLCDIFRDGCVCISGKYDILRWYPCRSV